MANCFVVVCRDAGNVFDFLEIVANFFAHLTDACYNLGNGFVDTAFEGPWGWHRQ